ncbi:muscular LMNA-interacting protein isoform X2 [Myripristis murdjan]|uniref:muscular LMNA-interacting protein isoform X2 n=1 Tax=Myripristis murdjan TaxID=586833 RepID=UPI0011760DA7|nr:muscular LMNA-interacting protein isoform X2 [Myripristis murdjan]
MESLNERLGKVSVGVPSKPSIFTFVPLIQKLPVESIIRGEERSGALTGKLNENSAVSKEKATTGAMSDRQIFKAEIVYIKDSEEGGVGAKIKGETRLQPHKIKLSYKSLAAIPTNTLLLDQQAIDDQVEREEDHCETPDKELSDTHAEMCSPAQLRQQSEELYAVIDEVLGDSIATCTTSRSPQPSRESTSNTGPQHMQQHTSSPKSLGRETKYATLCSFHPPASGERKLTDIQKTKPGVIRPATAIPRLTVEDEEKYHGNPFRQHIVGQSLTYSRKGALVRGQEEGSSEGELKSSWKSHPALL